MKLFLKLFVLCVFLVSCSTIDKLKQSITGEIPKENKEKIIKMASAIKFKSPKKLANSGRWLKKIKKGQWVTTLTTMKKKPMDVILSTTKVVKATSKEVIIETESYSASDNGKRHLAQVTFANYPKKSKLSYSSKEADKVIKRVKILKSITKEGDGPVQEVPKEYLEMSQKMGSKSFGQNVRSGKQGRGKCATPYLKSNRCYSYTIVVEAMGMKISSDITAHSQIPITGQVKLSGEQSDTVTIAYGYTGAEAKLK